MTTPLWRCSYCSAFQRGAHTPSCLSCGRVGGLCGSWKYEDAVRYLRGILDAEIDEQGALRAEVAALRADVTRLSRPNLITFDEDGELVSWAIPDEMHEEYGAELREIRDAGMALRWFFVGVAQWELRRLRASLARAEAMVPSEEECDAISYCAKIACRDLVEESTIAEAYVERLEAARVDLVRGPDEHHHRSRITATPMEGSDRRRWTFFDMAFVRKGGSDAES